MRRPQDCFVFLGFVCARATNQPLVILTQGGREHEEDAAFFPSVRALAAEIEIGVSTHELPTFQAVRDSPLGIAATTNAAPPPREPWLGNIRTGRRKATAWCTDSVT